MAKTHVIHGFRDVKSQSLQRFRQTLNKNLKSWKRMPCMGFGGVVKLKFTKDSSHEE